MARLIDSYSESNQDASELVNSEGEIRVGQSFTNSITGILDSAKFYLKRGGSGGLPTGNATVTIYAETHATAYGTDSLPTGSILATSATFDVSTLTTSYQLITFNFVGAQRISLNASTYYCVIFNYSGGDSTNYVAVGGDDSSPTASGNNIWYNVVNDWKYRNTRDTCFYVYGADITTGNMFQLF